MPSKFELEAPLALTDAEKRAARRFDAAFAFETMSDADFAARLPDPDKETA